MQKYFNFWTTQSIKCHCCPHIETSQLICKSLAAKQIYAPLKRTEITRPSVSRLKDLNRGVFRPCNCERAFWWKELKALSRELLSQKNFIVDIWQWKYASAEYKHTAASTKKYKNKLILSKLRKAKKHSDKQKTKEKNQKD